MQDELKQLKSSLGKFVVSIILCTIPYGEVHTLRKPEAYEDMFKSQ